MKRKMEAGPTSPEALMRRLREEMERPPFHALLKPVAEAVDAETGAVTVRLPYRRELGRSPDGEGYHGGAIATLIDLAAHAAVALQTGGMAPTVDLRIDYLKVAGATDLLAKATILHSGRSLARVDVRVEDADGSLIAAGRGVYSRSRT